MATVRISELESTVNREVLMAFCSPFGDIRSVDLPLDARSHSHKGVGYVEFYEQQDADDCVDNLDLGDLYGKTVRVSIATDRKRGL